MLPFGVLPSAPTFCHKTSWFLHWDILGRITVVLIGGRLLNLILLETF